MQKRHTRITIIWAIVMAVLGAAAFGYIWRERVISFGSSDVGRNTKDVSVLILGRVAEGQGGVWHNAPGLVDAIVLANYNSRTNTVNLISLPRDLYGTFGGETFKVNEVYRREKTDALLAALPDITGIQTDKVAIVDIGTIEKAIDLLGGVDIVLSSSVTDPVSGFRLESGEHHINGEDAAWILRNRYSPEGDFFREKNQHVVIEAVFDKFRELSYREKTSFALKILPELRNVQANFNIGELAPQFWGIGNLSFNSIVLDFSTNLLQSSYVGAASSSAYILLPSEGMDNYAGIKAFISGSIK